MNGQESGINKKLPSRYQSVGWTAVADSVAFEVGLLEIQGLVAKRRGFPGGIHTWPIAQVTRVWTVLDPAQAGALFQVILDEFSVLAVAGEGCV